MGPAPYLRCNGGVLPDVIYPTRLIMSANALYWSEAVDAYKYLQTVAANVF